jgi:hypothetical protein
VACLAACLPGWLAGWLFLGRVHRQPPHPHGHPWRPAPARRAVSEQPRQPPPPTHSARPGHDRAGVRRGRGPVPAFPCDPREGGWVAAVAASRHVLFLLFCFFFAKQIFYVQHCIKSIVNSVVSFLKSWLTPRCRAPSTRTLHRAGIAVHSHILIYFSCFLTPSKSSRKAWSVSCVTKQNVPGSQTDSLVSVFTAATTSGCCLPTSR